MVVNPGSNGGYQNNPDFFPGAVVQRLAFDFEQVLPPGVTVNVIGDPVELEIDSAGAGFLEALQIGRFSGYSESVGIYQDVIESNFSPQGNYLRQVVTMVQAPTPSMTA